MEWKNKKVAVIGCARSGISAVEKLEELGAIPFLSEYRSRNEVKDQLSETAEFNAEWGGHTEKVLRNELIIVSPGVPLDIPVLQSAKEMNIPIWSELEFGYQLVKNTSSKIIAVTGSNGKSTTVSLMYHILKESGLNVLLAGNIGKPFTSFPVEKGQYDYIVLEVSSFQLDTIYEFKPDIAVLLNITPDHLNRYHTFEAYKESKLKIFKNQTQDDCALINFDDPECGNISDIIKSKNYWFSVEKLVYDRIWFDHDSICIRNDNKTLEVSCNRLPIRGLHNVSNMLASSMVAQLCQVKSEDIISALKSFVGLEHRLEWVAEIEGKIFINDSKATNCVSVEKALASFDKPINLIMGGSDKKEDFSSLIPLMEKYVRNLIVLGETQKQIFETFKNTVRTYKVNDLEKAIYLGNELAQKGENILLSPGCASYDMYDNFEERGKHFKKIVNNLKHEN